MELTAEQGDVAERHAWRNDILQRVKDMAADLDNPRLNVTLEHVMHTEVRRARGRLQTEPAVARTLLNRRDEERCALLKQQQALALRKQAEHKKRAIQEEAKAAEAKLKKAKQRIQDIEGAEDSLNELKSFTPASLGQGHARGGGPPHVKLRMEVLDRVARHGGGLTPQQRNNWTLFKQAWDQARAEHHKREWGLVFAEIMQGLLEKIRDVPGPAVSTFMHNEAREWLATLPTLTC